MHRARQCDQRLHRIGAVLLALLLLLAMAGAAQEGGAPVEETVPAAAGQDAAAPPGGGLATWTTTIAQVVNFLILVLLMKYFLYGRITAAIDNRAKRIAAEQQDARTKQEEAEAKGQALEQKLAELEHDRAKRLEAAKAEAARLREELTQQAREEVGQAKARWQDALRQEQDQFMQSLRAEIGQQVCALSRDALARLASRDLESAMVDAFLSRLNTDRDALRQLLEKADRGALTVRSAFEMPDGARTRIEQAITGGGRLARVLFEVDTDLLCGIELRAEGNAIGWSLEKYLGEVEEDFRKTLGQASGRE
ncbi:MAG: hypothetical protein KBC05_18595 [Candidatus Hydrogenedentes bacterium]|nr:hypothetical protein [Candidatus Hydrogenedentota bacterium]